MRKLYPDNEKTQEIYNQDDNKATKQDIQDLSNQIEAVDDKVDNVADNLSSLQTGLAQAVNTNVINANEANITGTVNATDVNTTNVDATNIDADNADVDNLQADSATIASATVGDLTVNDSLNTGTLNTGDINSSGNISTPNGSVTADQGHFGLVVTQGLQVQNYTAESIDGQFMSATTAHFGDLAVNGEATIKELEAQEAAIDGLETEEIDIRNISWTRGIDWSGWYSGTYTVYVPHFENGTYHIQIRTANDVPVLTMEISNSVDNYFVRWSQDKIGRLLRIRQVHEGEAAFIEFDVNKETGEPRWDCYYSTVCQTRNVDAPMYNPNPSTEDVVIRYKVEYLNGSKFFKLVDLANDSSSGARLVKTATNNRDLATQHYEYDGTTVVRDYDYLPDQSLNKADNVEFYGLQVHDFETDNLTVPGDFKAKHIYDGPTLTAAQKAALPNDTLLIEEGNSTSYYPYAFAVTKTRNPSAMSDFYDGWRWSNNFTNAALRNGLASVVPAGSIVDYTANSILDDLVVNFNYKSHGYSEILAKYIVKQIDNPTLFTIFYANKFGIGAGQLELFSGASLDYKVDPSTHELIAYSYQEGDAFGTGNNPNNYQNRIIGADDEPMSADDFANLQIGDTFTIRDWDDEDTQYIVLENEIYIGRTTNVPYRSAQGTATISRKTTKSSTTQVKPIVPYDENGTSATDDRPLVYDTTSDTIKKATGDITAPADLSVLGDLSVAGDTEYTGDTTFNGDVTVRKNINANEDVIIGGDIEVENDAMFRNDVSIAGDLYVSGIEHVNDTETSQSSGNYLVLRHNNQTPMATGEKSGIAVYNYKTGETATLTVDKNGVWRIADNTATITNHSNLWYYDGIYYDTSFVQQTFVDEIKTSFDEDELADVVKNGNAFYHYDGTSWFAVTLVNNHIVTDTTAITDASLIATLESLTKSDLQFFRSLQITEISEVENEPLLTRSEASNLTNGAPLVWDATHTKATNSAASSGEQVWKSSVDPVSGDIVYGWGQASSGSSFVFANMAAYNTAKLIPEGQAGHIPNNAIVIIENETNYLYGDNQ